MDAVPGPKRLKKNTTIPLCHSQRLWAYSTQHNGWVAQLANEYSGKFDVLNRGFAGFSIVLADFNHFTFKNPSESPLGKYVVSKNTQREASSCRLVVIFLGVNDAALPSPDSSHVPLPEFRRNLSQMISQISLLNNNSTSPPIRMLLITPPLVDEDQWLITLKSYNLDAVLDRNNQTTSVYASAIVDVGSQFNIPVVDLFSHLSNELKLVSQTSNKKHSKNPFLYDGLHLNSTGNDILSKLVIEAINSNFPEISSKSIPYNVPSPKKVAKLQKQIETSLHVPPLLSKL
ncbi:GDSL esterase/lipase [Smittium mucronatum]|uniref:GDSL esterase/lipase n=1 Tax=Smittium mucronatum TaxID=133383 RepID=A0A1R0H1D9_9FUNG|nr:GDSL esterase/lipase [Smittium mucronatum]